MKILICTVLLSVFFASNTEAKVYSYVDIGKHKTSIDLANYKGQSFLSFMKETMYPAIEENSKSLGSGSHFSDVRRGHGVELRLTDRVSTYHVRYKAHWEENSERSGRSYAGVDHKPWNNKIEYVADASYKHYLTTLEKLMRNEDEIPLFFEAILSIVANCDPSSIHELSKNGQQVAADFVAVYVAEQYRHLISGKGKKLGRRHNWDDAHLQVTLLAPFHAGQKTKKMFYRGQWRNQIFIQKDKNNCRYQSPLSEIPNNHRQRSMNLTDYWQFNQECKRSGVNLTRRDFSKLGRAITPYLFAEVPYSETQIMNQNLGNQFTRNFISAIAKLFINNRAPRKFQDSEALVEQLVSWLHMSYDMADEISEKIDQGY